MSINQKIVKFLAEAKKTKEEKGVGTPPGEEVGTPPKKGEVGTGEELDKKVVSESEEMATKPLKDMSEDELKEYYKKLEEKLKGYRAKLDAMPVATRTQTDIYKEYISLVRTMQSVRKRLGMNEDIGYKSYVKEPEGKDSNNDGWYDKALKTKEELDVPKAQGEEEVEGDKNAGYDSYKKEPEGKESGNDGWKDKALKKESFLDYMKSIKESQVVTEIDPKVVADAKKSADAKSSKTSSKTGEDEAKEATKGLMDKDPKKLVIGTEGEDNKVGTDGKDNEVGTEKYAAKK